MIFTYAADTATISFDSSGYASTVVFYVHSNGGSGAVDWVTPHHVIPGKPNGGVLTLPATGLLASLPRTRRETSVRARRKK